MLHNLYQEADDEENRLRSFALMHLGPTSYVHIHV